MQRRILYPQNANVSASAGMQYVCSGCSPTLPLPKNLIHPLTGVAGIQWPKLQPPCAKAAKGYLTGCFCCAVSNNFS